MRRDVPAGRKPIIPPAKLTSGQWLLELPFTKPLSLNDRMNWQVKHGKTRPWRAKTKEAAEAAGIPPCKRITVELWYVPVDDRARDPLNLVPCVKAIEDGLVDAQVIADDSSRYHTSVMPQITPKGPLRPNGNRFWVIVTARQ